MESSSFLPRPPTQLFVACSPVLQAWESWVGGLGMRPGRQDSSTISCIPKPYVGLESGNETRDCTDTQYEAVNGCQMSLTFHTLLFLLWGKETVRVNETSFMLLAEEAFLPSPCFCKILSGEGLETSVHHMQHDTVYWVSYMSTQQTCNVLTANSNVRY